MDDRCDSPSIRRFHRPGMAKRESLSRFVSGKFKQPKQKLWELSTSRQCSSLPFPKFSPSCVCNLNVKEKIHLYTPVRLIGTEKSSNSTCWCVQIENVLKMLESVDSQIVWWPLLFLTLCVSFSPLNVHVLSLLRWHAKMTQVLWEGFLFLSLSLSESCLWGL